MADGNYDRTARRAVALGVRDHSTSLWRCYAVALCTDKYEEYVDKNPFRGWNQWRNLMRRINNSLGSISSPELRQGLQGLVFHFDHPPSHNTIWKRASLISGTATIIEKTTYLWEDEVKVFAPSKARAALYADLHVFIYEANRWNELSDMELAIN